MAEASENRRQYGIIPLNTNNYQTWSVKVQALMKKEGCWRAITTNRPSDAGDAQDEWDERDEKAQGIITLYLEDDQTYHVEGKETAKEMWNELKAVHEKSSGANKFLLFKELFDKQLEENGDVEKHISTFQAVMKNLVAIGCKSVQEFGVYKLLFSMPESYESIVSNLWSKPEDELTMDVVKTTLIAEYRRRKKGGEAEGGYRALKVRHFPRKSLECLFCDERGHVKAECPEYREWKQNQNKYQRHNRAATVKRSNVESSESDSDGATTIHEAYCAHQNKIKGKWFLDSAATSHMTNDIQFFEKLNNKYRATVRAVNGIPCKVHGVGMGRIECILTDGTRRQLLLKKVLYVPDLESGLISVATLDKQDYHMEIQNCRMIIFENEREVAVCDNVGHVYKLRSPEYVPTVMLQHPQTKKNDGYCVKGKNSKKLFQQGQSQNGYRLLEKSTGRIITTKTVKFLDRDEGEEVISMDSPTTPGKGEEAKSDCYNPGVSQSKKGADLSDLTNAASSKSNEKVSTSPTDQPSQNQSDEQGFGSFDHDWPLIFVVWSIYCLSVHPWLLLFCIFLIGYAGMRSTFRKSNSEYILRIQWRKDTLVIQRATRHVDKDMWTSTTEATGRVGWTDHSRDPATPALRGSVGSNAAVSATHIGAHTYTQLSGSATRSSLYCT